MPEIVINPPKQRTIVSGGTINVVWPTADAPSTDAYEVYDRSLERLTMTGKPIQEQVRAAFEAGYDAHRQKMRPTVRRGTPNIHPDEFDPEDRDGR